MTGRHILAALALNMASGVGAFAYGWFLGSYIGFPLQVLGIYAMACEITMLAFMMWSAKPAMCLRVVAYFSGISA